MQYLYLPNGYISSGVRIEPGVWSSDYALAAEHWQSIVDSKRGWLVNESGATAQNEKPIAIPQVDMLAVLRRQYARSLGKPASMALDSRALIGAILEIQSVDSVQTVQEETMPGDTAVETPDDLKSLREQYELLAGKRVYYGWGIKVLQSKIKELSDG